MRIESVVKANTVDELPKYLRSDGSSLNALLILKEISKGNSAQVEII